MFRKIFLQNSDYAGLICVAVAMNGLGLQLSINGQSYAGIGAAHVCNQILMSHILFPNSEPLRRLHTLFRIIRARALAPLVGRAAQYLWGGEFIGRATLHLPLEPIVEMILTL
jgi:hypothetical protein